MSNDDLKVFSKWCFVLALMGAGAYGGVLLAHAYPVFGTICGIYIVLRVGSLAIAWFLRKLREQRRTGLDDMTDHEHFVDEWDPEALDHE